ncbi:hypothetical protein SY111_05440 [Ligilactobacillus agilis]|uniref:Uncharacterized protein n=1 Tax=Ligilactobacillus agilis TaxID=1601 RepID=A0A6F9XRZ3_9LACO|nr:hypothetical protein [Ligilactobacillus agilis]GET07920.1 hypothetical protein SY111_05440 [Ligilactobacillus agilis]
MYESKTVLEQEFTSLADLSAFLDKEEVARTDVINIQKLKESYLLIYWG